MIDDPIQIAVYGEVDMNLIDGSSVWLQSVATMLGSIPGVKVTVLLRAPERRDILTGSLHAHPSVDVEPALGQGRLTTALEAVARLAELDEHAHFDHILLRGSAVTDAAVDSGRFTGRLWLYYIPPHGSSPGSDVSELQRRGEVADRILCQTEAIRARVEAAIPEHGSKLVLLPPMIPAPPAAADELLPISGPVRTLLYAGKLSPEYFFLEMVELFSRLREEYPALEFHVAGDKIHNPPDNPDFKPMAERALRETPGLVWHEAVTRDAVSQLALRSDLALSIRHPSMDASTELSTKILEYGAAGCPVLLNRNPTHVDLLGADYPLLCSNPNDAIEAVRRVSQDPSLRVEARRRCLEASTHHTFGRIAAAVAPHIRHRPRAVNPQAASTNVLVAGHALGFFTPIGEHIVRIGATLREDVWSKHTVHDMDASAAAAQWADTIMCEWCLGNAIFYSRRKRPDQRLVVRFHRMELETAHPGELALEQVDAMVFVAQHVMDAACEKYGWTPDERFHVVPNSVDANGYERPKLPGAQFALGLIGFVPMLKRLDRALDILERVRLRDDRYRLVIKGRPPWDYYWMFAREEERQFYERAFERLRRSPKLASAVVFEPYGSDISAFLQKIGFILSLSDIEGHAVALAEGMASGAIPVVMDRPGASDQYPPAWVHRSTDKAARAVLGARADDWSRQAAEARDFAGQWAWERLAPRWEELLGLPVSQHV